MNISKFSRKLGLIACCGFMACATAAPAVAQPASAVAGQPASTEGSSFLSNGVTAHRGYPEAYAENTFQGYTAAMELGADWIELDVFTTADGQLVVSHDKTTGRFADRDLAIAQSTYAQLSTLDVAHSFREEHGLTEKEVPPARMPLLSEILELVQSQDKTRASLQPKDQSTAAAVEMVQDIGAQKWVGFNDGNLAKMSLVKELDPSIHVFWDLPARGNLDEEIAIATDRGFDSLVVNQNRVSPEVIETIETAGFESGAWTVNETSTMQRFIGWGIDRLYTDSADQALLLFGIDPRVGLERGLLGHWSLDDVVGRTADDSGSPNPIRNGLLQSDAELTARGHGHLKGAVELDGTGDYVDVPFEVLPDESPAFTTSVWFKPEQVGARQPLLESSGSGAISMELAETGNLKYSVQTDGTSVVAASGVAPAAGQWHHAALTYDAASGASHLYLDGEEVTEFVDPQEAGTGTLARTDGLHLGSDSGAGRFFQGALDDAALWNRVLTGHELATIWNDGDGAAVPASYREAKGTPGWWEPRKN